MKRFLQYAFFLFVIGCGLSSEKSSLNEDVVIIETLDGTSFGDLFDAIPEGARGDFTPFQYARPLCANQSSCQISLPNGSSYSLDELQSMITSFDGNIKITQIDYEVFPKSPEYSPCYSKNCWPSWGPSGSTTGGTSPGGASPGSTGGTNPDGGSGGNVSADDDYKYNPNYLNASQLAEEDTRRRVRWAEDQIKNGINTPQGMGDIPLGSIPNVSYDTSISQGFQDLFDKQNSDFQNSMQAAAQQQAQAQGTLASLLAAASQEFTNYQNIKNNHRSKTNELSQKAKDAIDKSDFQSAEAKMNALSGMVDAAKSNRVGLATNVRQKIPATNSAPPVSQYKTDGFSVVGQAVRRADAYLGYVERSLSNYPAGNEGRVVADNLMKDSRLALEAADSSYARGNNTIGDSGLRFAYALADTALALGPVALLAAGPVGVVAAIGVEALNIGKSWYEYRTGKSLWTGEPLSGYQKDMAMANVVLSFVPGATYAGLGIITVFKKGTAPAKEILAAGKGAEEVVDISTSINNAEKFADSAKKLGVDEASDLQRILGSHGKPKKVAGDPGFVSPPKSVDQYGRLTNGKYTVSPQDQASHKIGSFDATNHTGRELPAGKSQFLYASEADDITLDAAAYADKMKLWDDTGVKAKVIFDNPIGVHHGTGEVTNVVNVYRKQNGTIHGSPASPQ